MSKTGIALAALFLGLALFQGARGLFAEDPSPPPPPVADETPSPTPEASPTAEASPTKSPKPEPLPTFEGPAPKPTTYGSTEELAAALADKGLECTTLEYLEQDDPTLEEFSLCDLGTTQRRYNIYFYPSAANRKLWVGIMKEQKLPLPIVYGPNWIVVAAGDPKTAMDRVKLVRGALGGTIKDFSPKGTG